MNFNPRSREGSDVAALAICDANTNFNPRSREGSDCPLDGPTLVGQISIHAPAKGATSTVPDDYPQYCVFQSTLPRRERRQRFVQNCLAVIFQSTLPRRERLIQRCLADPLFIFQSTLPRRERLRRTQPLYVLNAISIHAPAKGATKRAYVFAGHVPNFNPRSREGSDHRRLSCGSPACHFNPRSREGSDIMAEVKEAGLKLFQSTLPRRERPDVFISIG